MLNLEAYCDASFDVHTKQAVVTTIIISDMMFHRYHVGEYRDVETGARAELLGIIQTMEIVREMKDVGDIHIHCDSATTISVYRACLSSKVVDRNKPYADDWEKLLELSEGYSVIPENIAGHQDCDNPNKVCDLIARNVLRARKA